MNTSLFHLVLAVGLSLTLVCGIAQASDKVGVFASMESGTCRDTFTGEADTTQSVSLEYRHESTDFSVLGYGRVAPSGGNCAEDAFTFDTEIERRFQAPGDYYGIVRVGAERYVTTGVFRHVDDGLVLFANQADGSPAYTALVGAGRCFGQDHRAEEPEHPVLCVEAGMNLAPNDYVGKTGAQSGHFSVTYGRPFLGGDLELAVEAETPETGFGTLITGQRGCWSREISGRFDLSACYRRRGGLDNYASPFAGSVLLDGREYFLGVTDAAVSTFEVGFRADL